jgi:hypothetical protein
MHRSDVLIGFGGLRDSMTRWRRAGVVIGLALSVIGLCLLPYIPDWRDVTRTASRSPYRCVERGPLDARFEAAWGRQRATMAKGDCPF